MNNSENKGSRVDAQNTPIVKGGKHHISWRDEQGKGDLAAIKEVAQYKNGSGGCGCTVQ
jgi:hypothetical protein